MESHSYSQIGQLLQQARMERRLSLPQISHMLHIRARYLESLEQGRLADLPGVTYAKGYLQAYAAFLELDKQEVLRRFEQVEGELGKRGFYLPQVFSKEKKPMPWAIWGGIGMALAAYLFWGVVIRPEHRPVPLVEEFPQKKTMVSAADIKDIPCFQPQDTYYPTCTMMQAHPWRFTLSRRTVYSVMELAKF